MVVRNLLGRLGLAPDSPQLRIIATSASLSEDSSGLTYLEQFFGCRPSSFFVTAGKPLTLPPLHTLDRHDSIRRSGLPAAGPLSQALAAACVDPDSGRARATEAPLLQKGSSEQSMTSWKDWGSPSNLPTPKPHRRVYQFVRISSFARCAACGRVATKSAAALKPQRARAGT